MYCKLLSDSENDIYGLAQFNYTWLKGGCVSLQLSATVELATVGPHKAVYHKFLTKKELGPRERTAKAIGRQETRQMSLGK